MFSFGEKRLIITHVLHGLFQLLVYLFMVFNCSEETKLALTSAAFAYLTKTNLPKHIRVLSTASRTILLCGPSGSPPRRNVGSLDRKDCSLNLTCVACCCRTIPAGAWEGSGAPL
jgi:hypothetical protein